MIWITARNHANLGQRSGVFLDVSGSAELGFDTFENAKFPILLIVPFLIISDGYIVGFDIRLERFHFLDAKRPFCFHYAAFQMHPILLRVSFLMNFTPVLTRCQKYRFCIRPSGRPSECRTEMCDLDSFVEVVFVRFSI